MKPNALLGCAVIGGLLGLAPPSSGADEGSELRTRVQQLEQELRQQRALTERLVAKVEALERPQQAAPRVAEPREPVPAEATGLAALAERAHLDLRMFPRMGYTLQVPGDEVTNSFYLGETSFLMTSEMFERLGFLLESNFFFQSDNNSVGYTLQRLYAHYALSDLLNIEIGKVHTPLGYWNQAFHHGGWTQTTIERPEIYRFESDSAGGYLPDHGVGLEFLGTMELGPVELSYIAGVLNGRGRTASEIEHAVDKSDSKALHLLLSVSPEAIEGLTVGGLLYRDRIPSSPPTANRLNPINEWILGWHATYLRGPVALLGELFQIYHDDKTSGHEHDTLGFYVQGEYDLGPTTPYYRFDYLDVANSDPFFTGARGIDRTKQTLGLRWDLLPWNAIKLEYSYLDRRSDDNEHALAIESSFVF